MDRKEMLKLRATKILMNMDEQCSKLGCNYCQLKYIGCVDLRIILEEIVKKQKEEV